VIVSARTVRRRTRGNGHILDVTADVQAAIRESGVVTGQATLMVVGSTAALTTLEYEPGLVEHDLVAALERIAPEAGRYAHEETWHDDNGHSHVRAALIGPTLALPVIDGHVPLGTWQQVVLVDLDTRPRERDIILTVMGAARTETRDPN
jgi:secondary thiamine-phosphate synthase enzyme